MENEFLSLVSSPLMNLDHTYRYSGTKLVEPESLSQHIVDTIMLGLKVIDRINSFTHDKTIDPEKYVMKAIYHDLEEAITGDIPRPLKYYNAATLASLRDVADQVADGFFKKQFMSPEEHYEIWSHAKEGKEGYILKIVDTLVVANKVVKEVSLLHNFYMLRVAHEVSQYINELIEHLESSVYDRPFTDDEVNKYLIDVLSGAYLSMRTLIIQNEQIMNDLNIHGQSMV